MKAFKLSLCGGVAAFGAMITASGFQEIGDPAGPAVACSGMLLVFAAFLAALVVEVA